MAEGMDSSYLLKNILSIVVSFIAIIGVIVTVVWQVSGMEHHIKDCQAAIESHIESHRRYNANWRDQNWP